MDAIESPRSSGGIGQQIGAFVTLLVSVFLAHSLGRAELSRYLVLSVLCFLFPVFYMFEKKWHFFYASIGVITFSFLLRFLSSREPSLLLFLLVGSALWVLIGAGFRSLEAMLAESQARKKAYWDETERVREELERRKEKLKELNRQLDEIAHLFEVAKGFNECLSFEQILAMLRHQLFSAVPFDRISLLVLGEEAGSAPALKKFSVSQRDGEVEFRSETTPFDRKVMVKLFEEPKNVRIESLEEKERSFLKEDDVQVPLWLFPLFVEDRLIAIWVIEGSRREHYPKFAVVAAQLALQVQKVRLYETVRELSIVDGLTRVFVRRHFLERFQEELKRSLRHQYEIGVLILDIDGFKGYNDTYGHLVGDVTLREVARMIRETVRGVDMVGRYGGEEFVVLLPETSREGALEVSERIRSTIAKTHFKVYDEETRVTVSIGLACFPHDLDDPEVDKYGETIIAELLRHADEALYRAKGEGRNRVVAYERAQSKS